MNGFWSSQKERISQWGLLRTLAYYLFAVIPDKLGIQFLSAFEYLGQPSQTLQSSPAVFSVVRSAAEWTQSDRESLSQCLSADDLKVFGGFFARGDKCVVARCDDGQLASLCWVEDTTTYCLAGGSRGLVIHNCYTLPNHRGQGFYTQSLYYVCRQLKGPEPNGPRVFVDCIALNYASKRGIEKAGFTPIGTIVRTLSHTWSWSNRVPTVMRASDAVGTH